MVSNDLGSLSSAIAMEKVLGTKIVVTFGIECM